jgi:hypothetical protein
LALAAPFASAEEDGGASAPAWVAQAGDRVLVDTDTSIVYLVHEDGTSLALDGLTGQHRNICYIGRCYFAATPAGEWIVKQVEKKGRSTTFGEGRFLRLYQADGTGGDDGRGRTAYGIHSHLQFAQMLEDKTEKKGFDKAGTGWRSYGCILLSEDDLSLVTASIDANGGSIAVSTGPGLVPPEPVATVDTVPSWLGLTW